MVQGGKAWMNVGHALDSSDILTYMSHNRPANLCKLHADNKE